MTKQTPYSKELRLRWYRLVDAEKRAVGEGCKTFGIPRKTYYKWRGRDFRWSSHRHIAKQKQPKLKLTPDVKILIENEKLRTNYGPEKMKRWLQDVHKIKISKTVIYRFFVRRGLIRKKQKRLSWYEPLKERIIPTAPGTLVEADLKYVWLNTVRHYQFTFYDVFTGIPAVTIRTRKEDDDAIAAFEEAKKLLPFPIVCVQTDNGGEFRGDFHACLLKLGVRHVFIPKRSPWWSGHVERFNGVIDQEYYLNPLRAFETLPDYLHFYINDRIHLGKYNQGLPPIKRLNQYLSTVSPLSVT